jgi:hypothetical protein
MKCQFIKPDGTKCNANAMAGSNYCFNHNPATQKEKHLAVVKGGLAPKKFFLKNQGEVSLKTAGDAKNFLAKVINAVWVGEIPATPVANTLGFLVRCFLDAYEKAEIETRLDEIEQRLEKGGI